MVLYLRRASLADIDRFTSDPTGWGKFAFEEGVAPGDLVDFDKAWDALHFMLSEGHLDDVARPLGVLVRNDVQHGLDSNGFGGFSVISPTEMAAFHTALSALSDEDLLQRYDPEAMAAADVYLADMFVDEGDEAADYIMQGVPALRTLAASCTAAGDGALRILS